ncbi:uncharacterized protein [Centruroides vittatus]
MYLEAMHRVLKHCYLEGKVNKRVDHLSLNMCKHIHALIFLGVQLTSKEF